MVRGLSQEYNSLVVLHLVFSVLEGEIAKLLVDSDVKERELL